MCQGCVDECTNEGCVIAGFVEVVEAWAFPDWHPDGRHIPDDG